jgi:hypothetical protein
LRFYVVNRTGTTVHGRLDRTEDPPDGYSVTFTPKRLDGGKPLSRFVLVDDRLHNLPHLDGRTEFTVVDRMNSVVNAGTDAEGDFILEIGKLLN